MNYGMLGKQHLLLYVLLAIHYGYAAQIYPQARIVGGASASEGQFPHQISLRWGSSHVCGGSIVSANYVVTAAHCVATGSPPQA